MNNFIFENATKRVFGQGCVKEYLTYLTKRSVLLLIVIMMLGLTACGSRQSGSGKTTVSDKSDEYTYNRLRFFWNEKTNNQNDRGGKSK